MGKAVWGVCDWSAFLGNSHHQKNGCIREDTGAILKKWPMVMNCVGRNLSMCGEHPVFRRYDTICLGKRGEFAAYFCPDSF